MEREGVSMERKTYLDYYLHVCGLCVNWVPLNVNSLVEGNCSNPLSSHEGETLGFDCMVGRRCQEYEPTLEARILKAR